MPKISFIFTTCLILSLWIAACAPSDTIEEATVHPPPTSPRNQGEAFQEVAPPRKTAPTPTLASTPVPKASSTSPIAPTAAVDAVPTPDIPLIADELYFGLPAGNGKNPQLTAYDPRQEQVYLFNEGYFNAEAGNTISVFNPRQNQFTGLIELRNFHGQDANTIKPLALIADPYRPRLYALAGNSPPSIPPRGGELEGGNQLFLIDTKSQKVIGVFPNIHTVLPASNQIYAVAENAIIALNPENGNVLASQPLEASQTIGPMALNKAANRLYLAQGQPWVINMFEAATLKPAASYPLPAQPLQIIPNGNGNTISVVELAANTAFYKTYRQNETQITATNTLALATEIYGNFPVSHSGETLYWVERENRRQWLRTLNRVSGDRQAPIPLPCYPADLTVNAANTAIYAPCSYPDSVLLTIDLTSGAVKTDYTALTIVDGLAAPEEDRLYLLNNQGQLKVLRLSDHAEIANIQTGSNSLRAGGIAAMGRLSLDTTRNRLYLDGDPVQIIDTERLTITARLDTPGQLTPDPATDRLYLTPPCNCRTEQCNTLILNAQTLTGSKKLFPPADPLTADCVTAAQLDPANQVLFAYNNNGVPGSNSGMYYAPFEVSDSPQPMDGMHNISFGRIVFDPARQRLYAPRYRVVEGFLHRFEIDVSANAVSESIELAGAYGQLAFDPAANRLYVVETANHKGLQVFDDDLALLTEIPLPGFYTLLAFDPLRQQIYVKDQRGGVLVIATGGGERQMPGPPDLGGGDSILQQLIAAPNGVLWRIYGGQIEYAEDEGQSWTRLGVGLPDRPVIALALSPNFEADGTLFAGVGFYNAPGGLYRSTDGGGSWQPAMRGLTDMAIEQIVFSPTFADDQTIFLSTNKRGLYRSTNGGDSWMPLAKNYAPDEFIPSIGHIAVSPNFAADATLFISRINLLRSTDGGGSWQDTGIPGGNVAFSPHFTADGLILNDGRWRSADGGQSWQPAAAGREASPAGIADLQISPNFAADQSVYLLFQSDYNAPFNVQRSIDGGQSWQTLLEGLPPDFTLRAFTLHPSGDLILGDVNGSMRRVSPANLTWGRKEVDISALDLQAMVIDGDTIFVGNGQAGIYISTDRGQTWAGTNFPAQGNSFDSAYLAAGGSATIFAAVGPALEYSGNNGVSWHYIHTLPAGFEISALQTSPNFAADNMLLLGGSHQDNRILRSTDGGQFWSPVFDGSSIDGSSDVKQIAFSPNYENDGMVYAWLQYGGLLRSTDSGLTWAIVMPDPDGQYFAQSLAVSPTDGQVYIGALDGQLLAWQANGDARLNLGHNIPDERSWSSALAFGPDDALYLGTDRGVYHSADSGESWTRDSEGLPLRQDGQTPEAVRKLVFAGNALFAALTRGGVYVSTDGGETWQSTLP